MFHKVIYFFLLSIFYTAILPAQELSWTDLGNQWRYDLIGSGGGVQIENATLTADRDTTINDDFKCTILKATSTAFFNKRDIIIYVDEDDVVYQYADSVFWKLYDFDMAVGDEMDIYLPEAAALGIPNPFRRVRVDTVTTKSIDGIEVRAQYISHAGGVGFGFEGWNYEFLGNQEWYFVPINRGDCDGACPFGQLCYNSPETGIEVAFSEERPCDSSFVSTVYLEDNSEQFKVYPNPSKSGSSIAVEGPDNIPGVVQFSLLNQLGQLVLQRKIVRFGGRTELQLPGLPEGVYYLRWGSMTSRGRKKIVVTNL